MININLIQIQKIKKNTQFVIIFGIMVLWFLKDGKMNNIKIHNVLGLIILDGIFVITLQTL